MIISFFSCCAVDTQLHSRQLRNSDRYHGPLVVDGFRRIWKYVASSGRNSLTLSNASKFFVKAL